MPMTGARIVRRSRPRRGPSGTSPSVTSSSVSTVSVVLMRRELARSCCVALPERVAEAGQMQVELG